MLEVLRELYEEYLPELMRLATKRSKLNVRRYSKLQKEETGQGLSPSQYRELASDLSQAALADHWERYCQAYNEFANAIPEYVGDDAAELALLTHCANWLESSRLRFPRRFALAGVGLSRSVPPAPYWVSDTDSDPQTLCDSLLPHAQRQLATALLSGETESSIVRRMFGGQRGRAWKAYRQLRLNLLQSLSFIAELSREMEVFSPAHAMLDGIYSAMLASSEELPPAPVALAFPTGDKALELAQWYSRQGSANLPQVPTVKAFPESIEFAPVKVETVPPTVSPTWTNTPRKSASEFYADCVAIASQQTITIERDNG